MTKRRCDFCHERASHSYSPAHPVISGSQWLDLCWLHSVLMYVGLRLDWTA